MLSKSLTPMQRATLGEGSVWAQLQVTLKPPPCHGPVAAAVGGVLLLTLSPWGAPRPWHGDSTALCPGAPWYLQTGPESQHDALGNISCPGTPNVVFNLSAVFHQG